MDHDLMEAARAGNIEALYATIQSKPDILDGMDTNLFVQTPLHEAAAAGHTHFALEIMRLKPSFGKKLNPKGLSPLDLALQNKRSETVRRLVKLNSELIRVKGRESLTPLHNAAATDDQSDLLDEFLHACPESIKDLTIRDETALHIAVKSSSPKAVKVLLKWLRKTYNGDVLCKTDEGGNTVLHTAVSASKPQIVDLLVKEIYTDKKAKNSEGKTAHEIAATLPSDADRSEIQKILGGAKPSKRSSVLNDCSDLAEFFKSPYQWMEAIIGRFILEQRELTMDMRNTILVVAVLIATCTFTAILQPPGGLMRNTDTTPPTNTSTTTTGNNTHNINATMIIATTNFPTNLTHFNATIFATTTDANDNTSAPAPDNPAKKPLYLNALMTYGSFFIDFFTVNTVCFLASVTAMIFVLPLKLSSIMLHISLLFLIVSYGISFYVISPSYSYAHAFFLASYIVFPCVYSLWISISLIRLLPKIRKYRLVPHFLWKRIHKLRDLYQESIGGSPQNQIHQSQP